MQCVIEEMDASLMEYRKCYFSTREYLRAPDKYHYAMYILYVINLITQLQDLVMLRSSLPLTCKKAMYFSLYSTYTLITEH